MKINMLQEFKTFKGSPMQDGIPYMVGDLSEKDPKAEIDWDRTKHLNLKVVICSSLVNYKEPGELRLASIEAIKLMEKCYKNDEVNLKAEEIVSIKKAIDGSNWTRLIISQSEEMLEMLETD